MGRSSRFAFHSSWFLLQDRQVTLFRAGAALLFQDDEDEMAAVRRSGWQRHQSNGTGLPSNQVITLFLPGHNPGECRAKRALVLVR